MKTKASFEDFVVCLFLASIVALILGCMIGIVVDATTESITVQTVTPTVQIIEIKSWLRPSQKASRIYKEGKWSEWRWNNGKLICQREINNIEQAVQAYEFQKQIEEELKKQELK